MVRELETLTARVAALETIVAQLVPELRRVATVEEIEAEAAETAAREELLKRYERGRHANNKVNLPSDLLAIIAHYAVKKSVPSRALIDVGFTTAGKINGVRNWTRQYLDDYLTVHNVKDLYDNASKMKEVLDKYPELYKVNKEFNFI